MPEIELRASPLKPKLSRGVHKTRMGVKRRITLTTVSYALCTPATSKYSHSDDMHAFPGKCLFLGIDNCRQDVGTKESGSPKRVLHSLEETLLRIALVHSSVPFKIVDIGRSVSHAVRMTCFARMLLLFPIATIVQWVWDSSEFPL
ncbi:hypothetical protein KY290_015291 [Solanum tuberosum]|uniref:Uncharacterized protein n=1 Tax=Solanum tuberosum TaxID=4113 RepID=A0ABQ7VS65_SOLTU|nr:hypothetical protein KY290_015291 [Solanum tuberosum]